jgi:Sensors of blue-light using FAD
MSEFWHLLYRSEQTYDMEPGDLLKLLFDAREFNRRHDITGLLLHRDNRFMQLLEGRRDDVYGLYARIATDARHTTLVVEIDNPAEKRIFPDWQMGFDEAPRFNGHAVLYGTESEGEALEALQRLAREHGCARRLMWFLSGDLDPAAPPRVAVSRL